ncbi:unnamed protein product, partial [Ectocarpus sp. 4 AP-2014]
MMEDARSDMRTAAAADSDAVMAQQQSYFSEVHTEDDKRNGAGMRNGPETEGNGSGGHERGSEEAPQEGCLTLGPFWPGPLFHPGFVGDVLEEVYRSTAAAAAAAAARTTTSTPPSIPREEGAGLTPPPSSPLPGPNDRPSRTPRAAPSTLPLSLASRGQLVFLLEGLSGELPDCPLYYSLPDVAADRRDGGGDAAAD